MKHTPRYTGIPEAMRHEVYARDKSRCRWCGATNRGRDLHHIEYRTGSHADRPDNLITLCRQHHGFVHGTPAGNGQRIIKAVAQEVLQYLVEHPGTTGMSYWRSLKASWAREGLCEHGVDPDTCLYQHG